MSESKTDKPIPSEIVKKVSDKVMALLEYAKSKNIDITAEELNACKTEKSQLALIGYKLGKYITIRITFTIWIIKALTVIPFSQLLSIWFNSWGLILQLE